MNLRLLLDLRLLTAISAVFSFGCDNDHPSKEGVRVERQADVDSGWVRRTAGGASQLSGEVVAQTRTETASSSGLRHLIGQSSTVEGRKELYEMIERESVSKEFEDPAEYASRLIIEIRDEHEQTATIAAIVRCLPSVDSYLHFYKNLPSGKLRSMSAAGIAAWLVKEERLSELYSFFEGLPLGRDRVNVAKMAATECAQENGLEAAIDLVDSFEMEEEKINAISELISPELSEEIRNNPKVREKVTTVLQSLNPRDQEAISHFLEVR